MNNATIARCVWLVGLVTVGLAAILLAWPATWVGAMAQGDWRNLALDPTTRLGWELWTIGSIFWIFGEFTLRRLHAQRWRASIEPLLGANRSLSDRTSIWLAMVAFSSVVMSLLISVLQRQSFTSNGWNDALNIAGVISQIIPGCIGIVFCFTILTYRRGQRHATNASRLLPPAVSDE